MMLLIPIFYLVLLGALCTIALELARIREALGRIRDELSEANKRSKISNCTTIKT
jgi:hypothetical protein